jgi:signal transduction histidine kinase
MIEQQPVQSLSLESSLQMTSSERRLLLQDSIARLLAESSHIAEMAAAVLQMICATYEWDFGALWRVEPENHRIFTLEGIWHADCPELEDYVKTLHDPALDAGENSLLGFILGDNQYIWFSNFADIQSQDACEAHKAGLTSGLILPIQSKGRSIAILECLSLRPRAKEAELIDSLHRVGLLIGIFVEGQMLEETFALKTKQQHLLAQVRTALSITLDLQERLKNFLKVTVPELSDWCAIDLIDQNNTLKRMAAAHVNPDKLEFVYALQPTRTIDFSQENRPQVMTLLSGQSLLYTDLDISEVEKSIVDVELIESTRKLGPKSCIVVPLMASNRILGICTFIQAESGRRYSANDLIFAEDLGRNLALAVHNALLYAESLDYNTELEQRVEDRTAELKLAINYLSNQITERKNAEEQVRRINADLERRIAERTTQLEAANRELHKEVVEYEQVSQDLRLLLKRTQELYRISQAIGAVHLPNDVLSVLLSSSYLHDASRASIAILDEPWLEDGLPPGHCFILAEWNRSAERPRFFNDRFTLEEYGILVPVPYAQPIVIPDIQSIKKLPKAVRARFSNLHTKSLIILPLIANGKWYGLLSLHFSKLRMPNLDDLRHVRGLVDETAIAIQNIRLMEAETQARQEAEAANELKLKFLAMISHELRTPLASIKGFATTLLADDVIWPPEKQRDFLQTIDSEADKLSDLIEQMLDLSRMEAGVLRILPKRQSLYHVINSALPQLHALSSDHELVVDIPSDLPQILGDEQRIAQVLTNLVGNAAKYSPSQTKIIVSGHVCAPMIQVDVADQGIGIPATERSHIFEAFYQTKSKSSVYVRGAGLGLAICKGLVEAQGGTIWLQDRPGPGTTISFTLPISGERDGIKKDLLL